jgi:hypothetical protein
VLIASPGDVRDARDIVERELHEWNSAHSATFNVTLQPRRWETDGVPLLARGDAQSVLNQQIVDDADIVLGVFHTRLGSPTVRAASGTAEELERTSAAGKPVHVWFCEQPLPYEFDAEQFRALRAFRKALETGHFVGTFMSESELRTKVRRALDYDVRHFLTIEDDATGAVDPPPPDDRQTALAALEDLLELPLTDGRLPHLKEIDPYSLGVTLSDYAGRRDGSDQYVERESDARVRAAVKQNHFTVVVGPSKAGKSRTAYEAAVRVFGDARLVVPRIETRALPHLATNEVIIDEPDVVMIWLDDLDRFLVPAEGFDQSVLRRLTSRGGGRTVLLATLRRERRRQLRQAGELERGIRLLLNAATQVGLESGLTEQEREAAARCYPAEDFSVTGIGELLASVPELRTRYEDALPIPLSLLHAAIDWTRATQRPIPEADLRGLAVEYLAASQPQHRVPEPSELAAALAWATTKVGGDHGHVSLLKAERRPDGSLAYRAFDFLIDLRDETGPVPEMAVDFIRGRVSPDEVVLLGRQAAVRSVKTHGDDLGTQSGSAGTSVEARTHSADTWAPDSDAHVDRTTTFTDRRRTAGGTGSIFVSYSSRDHAVADQLVEQLRAEGFASFFLDVDPEDGIAVGRNWERELYAGLQRADVVIFLASSASVRSPWNAAEIGLARSLGKPVLPVQLEPGAVHALLGDVQSLDATHVGEEGMHTVVAGLVDGLRRVGVDPSETFAWDPARSPYPGLAPFTVDDAAVFFGRDPEVDQLVELLQATPARGGGRFVAIVGPSGSGKSSLLRAGLLPRLLRRRDTWVVLPPFSPGAHPMRRLAQSLAAAFAERHRPCEVDELEAALAQPDGLGHLVGELAELGPEGAKVLVVVDQAEELLTQTGAHEEERFLWAIKDALNGHPPMWAVATVRSEFLSTTSHRSGLAEAFDDQLVIEPLSRSRLPEVITRPAQRAGLTFVPGLVERMVEDAGGGDALPLLAYTLRELAFGAGPDGTVSHNDYEAVGGVISALQRSADRLTDDLTRRGVGPLVVPTLLKLVTVTENGEPTRLRASLTTFTEDERAIVDAFVAARLMTGDATTAELAHEALLRRWRPLADAIQDSLSHLRLRRDLHRLVADWQQGHRDESYLIHGARLWAFDEWARDHGDELDADGQRFLDASRSAATRDLERMRRSNRRVRSSVAVIVALLVMLLITAIIAIRLFEELQRLRGV